jgi:hypothetical protein
MSDEADLVVAEVFGPTFQGEGPSLGRRAGFVRLGRCNLDCSWCDTPFTWDWDRYDPAVELRRMPVTEVVARLEAMEPEIVVVTGGEPLLQQRRLVPLAEACVERGWEVEVETNGTLAPGPGLTALVARWNVSPKLANSSVAEDRRISCRRAPTPPPCWNGPDPSPIRSWPAAGTSPHASTSCSGATSEVAERDLQLRTDRTVIPRSFAAVIRGSLWS